MNQKERKFVALVTHFYKKNGRHDLPWRKTKNPYHILVSEIMLQQTQVDRVVAKYQLFLKTFPSITHLSQATLGEVLKVWLGLGYNRRAKSLHSLARKVMEEYGGKLPKTKEALIFLPGVGDYTAGAIMAFAHNKPPVIIETNIRSAYLHFFFKNKSDVSDTQIKTLIAHTLDTKNPREWYWALMDYGSHIKKLRGNPNKRSKHHTTQKSFKGSDREVRGAILRLLVQSAVSRPKLIKNLPFERRKIETQLKKLEKEGLIQKKKRGTQSVFTLP